MVLDAPFIACKTVSGGWWLIIVQRIVKKGWLKEIKVGRMGYTKVRMMYVFQYRTDTWCEGDRGTRCFWQHNEKKVKGKKVGGKKKKKTLTFELIDKKTSLHTPTRGFKESDFLIFSLLLFFFPRTLFYTDNGTQSNCWLDSTQCNYQKTQCTRTLFTYHVLTTLILLLDIGPLLQV